MRVVRTIAEAGYDNVPMVRNIVFSHQHVICLLTVPLVEVFQNAILGRGFKAQIFHRNFLGQARQHTLFCFKGHALLYQYWGKRRLN